jgi:integrase
VRGKGEGAVYFDEIRGLYVGTIELPPLNGKRRRKTIRRKDKGALIQALSIARAEYANNGDLPTSNVTVEQWFRAWLKLTADEVRPNTLSNYRTVTEKYVIPSIGTVKLDKVAGSHLRRVYDSMKALGLSSTYMLNAHRVMSTAFKIAVREGRININPIVRVAPPRKAVAKIETLDLAEGLQVLAHVAGRPDGARWATALLTGARRGEVIGLEVDRVTDHLDLSWQLQRIIWSHGCGNPVGTNAQGQTLYPCRSRRGTDCPEKHLELPQDYEHRNITGGLYLTRPKSSAGWRIVPLVDPLRTILERHIAASEPNPAGLVFTRDGGPYDPDQDSKEWRKVLAETGIQKNVRLHDLRHTTVELLYAAGVPEDIIMAIVGHSSRAMTRAYRTRTDTTRLRAAMEQFSAQFMPSQLLQDTPAAIAE